MTRRRFVFGLASLLLAIILSGTGQLQAQEPAVVLLEPQTLALGKGESGSVVMRIEGASNVYGVQIDLSFDANQIRVLDADESKPGVQIRAGDFLAQDDGVEATNLVDNDAGQVIYAYSRLAPAEPASGSGTLFEFDVEALESGSIDLLLESVIVASPEGDPLPVRVGDATDDNGTVIAPTFTATSPAQASTPVSATDVPISLTPTAESSQSVTPTVDSPLVKTQAAAGPADENTTPPTETEAAVAAPVSSGELPTSTLPVPSTEEGREPAMANTSTAEPAKIAPATKIAAAPPPLEEEGAIPAAAEPSPALTVIGQNGFVDESQPQAATPAPIASSEGIMEGAYVAIGLVLLIVALIAIWFIRRLLAETK